jgi:tight adherence protein B
VTLLAVVAAALVAALAVWPAPALACTRRRLPRGLPVAGVAGVAALTAVWAPGSAALVGIAAGTTTGLAALAARRSRARTARDLSARALETCELLAAELGAGQPPGHALRSAAAAWPALGPVAEAFDLGSDVPAALHSLSRRPGAGDLRLLAAAWAVAHRTGGGLADAVRQCAEALRAAHATRRLVEGELSSARATVRLVAGLPVLALLMGSSAGGDPLGFLLGHPVGLACLGGGLACALAGLWWIEGIAADVEARS